MYSCVGLCIAVRAIYSCFFGVMYSYVGSCIALHGHV